MKKSQSPLVGSNRRRYRQHRAVRSGTFRRFRSAFAKEYGLPPVGNGPYRIAADNRQNGSGLLLRLSKTGILAGLLAVLFAVTALRSWQAVERSGIFQIRQVNVQGCRAVREEELLALADLRLGRPLFDINLIEAEERIRTHPWIDTVRIRRSWPDTLHVLAQERQPLALVNMENGKGLHYMDQHGMVFAQVSPGQDIDFPVFTGFMPQHGSPLADGLAAEAVEFLRLTAQGNPILPMQALSEIHLSRDGEIIAYLAERPFPIHLGHGRIKSRYYQLVRLLERLYRKDKIKDIREIRMNYQPGRILVAKLKP